MSSLKKRWENFKETIFVYGMVILFAIIVLLGIAWPLLKTAAVLKFLGM